MRNIIFRLAVAALSFLIGVSSYHLHLFISHKSPILTVENPVVINETELQKDRAILCRKSSLKADRAILSRVERKVRKKDPEWHFIPGFCTCGAEIPDQKAVILGLWERKAKSEESDKVWVDIYEAGTCEGVALWMSRLVRGELWGKWKGEKYELADEAYVTPPFEGNPNYTLLFRLDNLVVEMHGKSLPDVERFAKDVLAEIPAR